MRINCPRCSSVLYMDSAGAAWKLNLVLSAWDLCTEKRLRTREALTLFTDDL